jgi:hypothetical protein
MAGRDPGQLVLPDGKARPRRALRRALITA